MEISLDFEVNNEILDVILEDVFEEEITNCQTVTEFIKNYKYDQIQKGITDFENILLSIKLNPLRIETVKSTNIIRPYIDIDIEINNIFDIFLNSKKSLKLLYLHENNKIQRIKNKDNYKIIKSEIVQFDEFVEFSPKSSEDIEIIKCYLFVKLHKYSENYNMTNITDNSPLKEYHLNKHLNFLSNITESNVTIHTVESEEFENIIFEFEYNYSDPIEFRSQ